MSRSPHREHRTADRRDRSLGATAQCRSRPYQMDVHNRKSPRQNGSCLSAARLTHVTFKESKPLCRGTSCLSRGAMTIADVTALDRAKSDLDRTGSPLVWRLANKLFEGAAECGFGF